jgi:hypothetical protein
LSPAALTDAMTASTCCGVALAFIMIIMMISPLYSFKLQV